MHKIMIVDGVREYFAYRARPGVFHGKIPDIACRMGDLVQGGVEMRSLVQTLCDLLEEGESVVMATVVKTPGQQSRVGAKMLVCSGGVFHGTVGGGLLEKETLTIASEMFASVTSRVRVLEFSGEAVSNMQTLCGKGVTVFIERIAATAGNIGIYRKILASLHSGVKCCLITDASDSAGKRRKVHVGLVCEDGSTSGKVSCRGKTLSVLLQKARSATSPVLQNFEKQKFLIDPWVARSAVYLFGAGHVAREVADLTGKAGFRTIVLDDRERFACPEYFPLVDDIVVLDSFDNCFEALEIQDDSFVIIITRERRYEKAVVRQALATRAGYIGIIGSIRKRDALFRELMDTGFSIDDMLRIYCPVGINILAETPSEIAISIAAQLVLIRAQRIAGRKKAEIQMPPARISPLKSGSDSKFAHKYCATGSEAGKNGA
jgi:xanthine dehydrogenase accessory factor